MVQMLVKILLDWHNYTVVMHEGDLMQLMKVNKDLRRIKKIQEDSRRFK